MTSEPEFRAEDERGGEHPLLEIEAHPRHDSVLVVDIRGELDMATGPILKQHLQSVVAQAGGEGRRRSVVYRLPGLEFIDASGLNALLTAWDGADKDTITIEEPSRAVRRLLGLLGLESMIEGGQRVDR